MSCPAQYRKAGMRPGLAAPAGLSTHSRDGTLVSYLPHSPVWVAVWQALSAKAIYPAPSQEMSIAVFPRIVLSKTATLFDFRKSIPLDRRSVSVELHPQAPAL